MAELVANARYIGTRRGLLANDETNSLHELFSNTTGIQYISGMVLNEAALNQSNAAGKPYVEILKECGVLSGIRVDKGTVELAGTDGETITEGLDGLASRCQNYYNAGARFAMWRSVLKIGPNEPSELAISLNANALASFAITCQENGLVPIVQPEIILILDPHHTIEKYAEVTERVLSACFKALNDHHVLLEGTVLSLNMVTPGSESDVAEHTLRALQRTVPAAVPTVVFLSGAQSEEEARHSLNAINQLNVGIKKPWSLVLHQTTLEANDSSGSMTRQQEHEEVAIQLEVVGEHVVEMTGLVEADAIELVPVHVPVQAHEPAPPSAAAVAPAAAPGPYLFFIFIGVITVQCISAGLPIMAKRGIDRGLDSYVFTLYRNSVGAILLSLVVLFTPYRTIAVQHFSWRDAGLIFLLGVLEPVLNQNLIYSGIFDTSSGFSQLMSMLQPTIVFISAWAFRMERVRLDRLSGKAKASSIIFTAVAAVITLTYTGASIRLHTTRGSSHPYYDNLKGTVCTCLALIASTCYGLLLGKTLEIFPAPIALVAGVTTIGSVLLLIGALTIHRIDVHRFFSESPEWIEAIVYAGVLSSSLGSVITAIVVRRMGPVFSSAFSPLALIAGMLFSFLVDRHPLFVGSVVAVSLVSVGLALLVWGKHQEEKEDALHQD